MAKVTNYQTAIMGIIEEYAAIPHTYPTQLKDEIIADTVRHHYQLVTTGWENGNFVYEVLFHFDIVGQKIWIQQNNTEVDLLRELTDRGIRASDVVIGYLQPQLQSA